MVMGPTPPGTGVRALATLATTTGRPVVVETTETPMVTSTPTLT